MCEVKICPASVAVPSKREQDVLRNQNRLFSVRDSVQRPSSALHTLTLQSLSVTTGMMLQITQPVEERCTVNPLFLLRCLINYEKQPITSRTTKG